MTSNQRGLYTLGDTRATMARSQRVAKPQGKANPIKTGLSSDWGLQLAPMKLESLVTVDQPCHGEYVLGSCTHRPSHQESEGYPKSHFCGPKVKLVIWVKFNGFPCE